MVVLFGSAANAAPPVTDAWRELTIAALGAAVGVLLTLIVVVVAFLRGNGLSSPSSEPGPATEQPIKRQGTQRGLPTSGIAPELLQALMEARRSVMPKNMTGNLLRPEHVKAILASAPWAPNHGKTEPWRFTVFGGDAKAKLLDWTLKWYRSRPASFWKENFVLSSGVPEFADAEAFSNYYTKAAGDKWGRASHLVAISVRRQRPEAGKKQHPEWEETCAVACAVQNMHLLATSLQVGAYWSSWYAHYRASDECVRDLGLDPAAGDRCLGVFVLGEQEPNLSNRASRLPLEQIATWQ